MSRLLILGAGWVASRLSSVAAAAGFEVDVVDARIEPWLRNQDTHAADMLRRRLESSRSGAVINTIGCIRGNAAEMSRSNAEFPAWLVQAIGQCGRRLVHVGSAAEYGDPGSADPIPECAPTRPATTYGATKLAGSVAVMRSRSRGLDVVVGRGFNLVGAGLPVSSPLGGWLTEIARLPDRGGTIEVSDARQVRDFLLLDDFAGGLLALATAPEVPDVVNLCSSIGIRYGDIVEALVVSAGKVASIRSLEEPGIASVVGDNSRLAAVTGRLPAMSLGLLVDQAAL